MLDIKKLIGVGQANPDRAERELDRMINVHLEKAEEAKSRIRKYLYYVAVGSDTILYGGGHAGSSGIVYAQHMIAAEMLRELKEQLQEDVATGRNKR